MDDRELAKRGQQLVLGAAMITLGGLLTLFGVMYGPLAQPESDLGGVTVTDRARDLATLTAVAAVALGLGAAYCYRGSIPMMFASLVVVVAGGHNLLQLLPYY
jgi:CBS-domain-containing membrane protein